MTTAADILENAALTKRYAQETRIDGLAVPRDPEARRVKTAVPDSSPARVYVLLQSGTVLGVLSIEDRALDEAHSLMRTYGGVWQEQVMGRYWRLGPTSVEISVHDVR